MFNKFIFSDNEVLSDKTLVLDDYHSGTAALTFVAAEDKVYIGSKYPITRKWFKVSSANAVAATASLRYWDGNQWRSVINLQDGTASSGVPLAASGALSWETDKRYPWVADDTTIDGANHISGFGTTTFYDFYWLELTYSANVSGTLAWFGDVLCTDNQIGDEYPDLLRSNVLTAFEDNKTSWEAQRVAASKLVSQDLKAVMSPAGAAIVLSLESLALACVAKTAEIIFRGLGQGYADSLKDARDEYKRRIEPKHFVQDENGNARPDPVETSSVRVTRLYR